MKTTQELLYECIRELQYVQAVENCKSGLCASSKGRELIEAGMEHLGCKGLGEETYFTEMRAEADQGRTTK